MVCENIAFLLVKCFPNMRDDVMLPQTRRPLIDATIGLMAVENHLWMVPLYRGSTTVFNRSINTI